MPETAAKAAEAGGKRKLGYKEARELEQLPARIEALEARMGALTEQMHTPAFFQRDHAAVAAHNDALAECQDELEAAYARWMELEAGNDTA